MKLTVITEKVGAFSRNKPPKARFPLGEFVRLTRGENKNPAT